MTRSHRCALCDCTVRPIAEGGNGRLMELEGRVVLVHAACKRLHEGRKR